MASHPADRGSEGARRATLPLHHLAATRKRGGAAAEQRLQKITNHPGRPVDDNARRILFDVRSVVCMPVTNDAIDYLVTTVLREYTINLAKRSQESYLWGCPPESLIYFESLGPTLRWESQTPGYLQTVYARVASTLTETPSGRG